MAAALRLGQRHLGQTGINPSVATLIVNDGVIVGRGITAHGGKMHSEPLAIQEAGNKVKGATAYVTLEPCAHRQHDLPCSDSLIAAKVKRVVTTVRDVNPLINGNGISKLRAAGIDVVEGVHSKTAARQHAGHIMRVTEKRPFVQMKIALTANGVIGARTNRLMVTGNAAQNFAQRLRTQCDAIAIGIGTALADTPLLTSRLAALENRSPRRFVFDRHLRMPSDCELVKTAKQVPLALFVAAKNAPEKIDALRQNGVEIIEVADDNFLKSALQRMSELGVTRLLLEAGASMAAAFMAHDLIDQALIIESDKLYVDADGVAGFAAQDWQRLTASTDFEIETDRMLGEDRLRSFWRVRPCLQG